VTVNSLHRHLQDARNNRNTQLATTEQCLSKVHNWLLHNGLSPNPAKSDAVQFTTGRGRRCEDNVESVSVSGVSCCHHTIYHSAVSIVTTRLDYCNSLFFGMSTRNFAILQRVKNTLACVLLQKRKIDHITLSLMELHWLPIQQRVHFKLAVLTYKTIHTQEPDYFFDIIKFYAPLRTLRSSSRGLLSRIRTRAFKNIHLCLSGIVYLLTFVTVIACSLLDAGLSHFYLTLHSPLSHIDILPTPTNSLTRLHNYGV